MYNIEELRVRLLSELKEIAEELGVKNRKSLKKDELVYAILDQQAITPEQALPKKKPSTAVEPAKAPEIPAEGPKPAAAAAPKPSEEPEYKPKFKRQNVTAIPKSEETPSQEQKNAPEPKNSDTKSDWKAKKEAQPERPERKPLPQPESNTEEPKTFRPRRKAVEEVETTASPEVKEGKSAPITKPAQVKSEQEIELPKEEISNRPMK